MPSKTRGYYRRAAMQHAVENGLHDAVENLLEDGADVNAILTPNGCTALLMACQNCKYPSVIKTLYEWGACVTIETAGGKSAKDLALEQSLPIFNLITRHEV